MCYFFEKRLLGDVKVMKKIEMTKKATLDQGYDEFIFNCKARNLREYTIKFYQDLQTQV